MRGGVDDSRESVVGGAEVDDDNSQLTTGNLRETVVSDSQRFSLDGGVAAGSLGGQRGQLATPQLKMVHVA